ncbi:hypothetical protein H4R34_006271 [Dimargaris verticillata]|uniref:Uncharacterized protein n=1 Tax=Dimargaris verticillata TaxID=2761393 RepID=A0A9W8AYA2_9FUNG|nr:hypothetical protein H4R34_006271 [Dimargaris verticillata]
MSRIADSLGSFFPKPEANDDCQEGSRRFGVVAGATAAFLGLFISEGVLKMAKYPSVFAGSVTGLLSGYAFYRLQYATCQRRKQYWEQQFIQSRPKEDE